MITVIVPVYKVEPYLRQCIESILNQTYTEIEILLINDGSPDDCGKICEEYACLYDRVRAFHIENRGLSAARNYGLQQARGAFIGFVDSDDWIEPGMFQNMLHKMEKAGADICVCGYWEENGATSILHQFADVSYTTSEALDALLAEKINNNVWNKLYRRELFRNICFPDGKNYEDIAVMHNLLYSAGRVAVIPAPEYHYRVRQESITKTYSAANLIDFADAYLCRYFFFLNEEKELFIKNRKELLHSAAKGISKVWRWWHGCKHEDRQMHEHRIRALARFSKENFPLFGFSSWPRYLRLSAPFMHSRCKASFAVLYALNQMFRKIWPEQGNVVLNK